MEDAYLASVVRHVEEGGEPVKVPMALTSGVVVTGFVRRAAFFASVSERQAHDQHRKETTLVRKRGETSEEAYGRRNAEAQEHADRISVYLTTPTGRLPMRSRCRT